MAAQLGYWLTHTVVFAWMDSWSKCQYCCMLLWSSVTIIKFENHYCYHTQNKSKNNNKFSKNDKKVRTDNFFNQWLWVTQWLSDLQRYCKQTGLALQPAAWHHFKVIPDSSRTIWPALCVGTRDGLRSPNIFAYYKATLFWQPVLRKCWPNQYFVSGYLPAYRPRVDISSELGHLLARKGKARWLKQ